MKQRFLNQKLGKRMSHKTELRKAKAALARAQQPLRGAKSNPHSRAGHVPQGSALSGTTG